MPPRYTPLSHEDSDEDSSPEEHLLSVSSINSRLTESPKTCSATLNPALLLRLVSLVLGIIAFIILIVDGDGPFIATDIFLAFVMIFDFAMVIHHAISDVFQVTVQLRHGSWKSDIRGSEKSNAARYTDIGLTSCLTVSLITGNAVRADWPGIWIISAVFGYIIIIMHILLAIPALHKNNFTLTISAKLSRRGGKKTYDSRDSVRPSGRPTGSDAGSEAGLARERTVEPDEPRQPVQDLV